MYLTDRILQGFCEEP